MMPAPVRQTPSAANVDFSVLARRLKGEVRADAVTRCLYASSASIVEIWPQAVLTPKDANDVVEAMRFCRAYRVPVTCRGAGSGVAGQSLGEGLIIDFSVHMNKIIEINEAERWVRLEPGMVKDALDQEVSRLGLFWPPDPSSSSWCTVGAMIANNSGGALSIRYGTTRDYLLELDLVNWEGERFVLRPVPIASSGRLCFAHDATETEKRLAQQAYDLLKPRRAFLKRHKPQATRCSSGLNIFQVLALDKPLPGDADFDERVEPPPLDALPKVDDSGTNVSDSPWLLDMPRLFCGSEGTLAALLSVKLRLAPKPKASAGASFSFDSDERMAEGVVKLLAETRPAKLELLDRTFIDVAALADKTLAAEIPDRLRSMLIVEYFDESADAARARVDAALVSLTSKVSGVAFAAARADDPRALENLWRIRKVASPLLSRVKGDHRPTRWVEDVAVPPWKLPVFIAGIKEIFARNGFSGALFGHAGEGNLHVNPRVNVKEAEQRSRMKRCADEVYELARSLGGVMSGEHGDGVMRAPYLRAMFGEAYDVMLAIKREWDPHWLMNPLTKLLSPEHEGKRYILDNLRMGEGYERKPTGTGLDDPAILEEIEKCHGCGKCRQYCPLTAVSPEEKYSARAKANLLRGVISGRLDPANFLLDAEFKATLDLCINCGQCLTDCPTAVDIPAMAIVFREQFMQRQGQGALESLLAKPDALGKVGALVPRLANTMLASPPLRRLAEKASDLDQRRRLPEYRKAAGLPKKKRLNIPGDLFPPREVALFPGCWANYYDPDGERNAFLRVCEALGVAVHAPALRCCGISKLTQGDRAGAAADLAANVEILAPIVARGARVLFTAPSCLLAFTHDMPRLLKGENARAVAAASLDAHRWLFSMFSHPTLRSQLKPLAPGADATRAAYHQPCHSKVSGVGADPLKLIELLPTMKVENLDAGCCGLSGSFGMKTGNFDASMAIGARLFHAIERESPEVVFTPCGVCQTQIKQGAAGQRVVHPLRLLYDALP